MENRLIAELITKNRTDHIVQFWPANYRAQNDATLKREFGEHALNISLLWREALRTGVRRAKSRNSIA